MGESEGVVSDPPYDQDNPNASEVGGRRRVSLHRRIGQSPNISKRVPAALAASLLSFPIAESLIRGNGHSAAIETIQSIQGREVVLSPDQQVGNLDEYLSVDLDALGFKDRFSKKHSFFYRVPTELNSTTDSAKEVVPFIKVKKTSRGIELIDTTPGGMRAEIKTWFQNIISSTYPIVEAGLNSGNLDEIVFSMQNTFKPSNYYDASIFNIALKKAYIDLDPNKSRIDPLEIKATILHEVGHALFSKHPISSMQDKAMKLPDVQVFQGFKSACSNLRDFVIDDLEEESTAFIALLNNLRQRAPNLTLPIDKFISHIKDGSLNDIFARTSDKDNSWYLVPQCEFSSGIELLDRIANLSGVNFDISKLSRDALDVLYAIDDIPLQYARNHRIFKVFTESTYLRGEHFGHPYDSLDEAAASLLTLTVLFPDKLGRGIATLPQNQKDAVRVLWNRIMETFSDNPAMNHVMRPYISHVNSALGV